MVRSTTLKSCLEGETECTQPAERDKIVRIEDLLQRIAPSHMARRSSSNKRCRSGVMNVEPLTSLPPDLSFPCQPFTFWKRKMNATSTSQHALLEQSTSSAHPRTGQ